jgi:hypothetical protein
VVTVLTAACQQHAALDPAPSATSAVPAPKAGNVVPVSGTVLDIASGRWLSGAGLELSPVGQNSFVIRSAASGNGGKFTMDPVPPGAYTLRVGVAGYAEQRIRVDLTRGDQPAIDIRLRAVDTQCPTSRYHLQGCP